MTKVRDKNCKDADCKAKNVEFACELSPQKKDNRCKAEEKCK